MKEVLEIFDPQPGQTYIDMTINGGGHSVAIAEKISPGGTLMGIDWDQDLIERLRIENKKTGARNIDAVCDNYAHIRVIAKKRGIKEVDGILLDLGFSSYHTDESGRGFSFLRDEPLDMRYSSTGNAITAEHIVNRDSREALERIIREYGEERYAGRIARAIAEERERRSVRTTRNLADIVRRAVPAPYRRGRIHPATRTFQALRIAVNCELENLRDGLDGAVGLLSRGGTVIVLSFHSLEDRIVKRFFKEKSGQGIVKVLTQKPVGASDKEKKINPRSRSARLRAAQRL